MVAIHNIPRKIVRTMLAGNEIFALSHDGLLFVGVPGETVEDFKWEPVPALPPIEVSVEAVPIG